MNFVVIPNSKIHPRFGTDSTRKFLFDHAVSMGYSKIIDVDDDIDYMTMAYNNPDTHTSRRIRKSESVANTEHILSLSCKAANDHFKLHKDAMLGSFCRIFQGSCKEGYANLKSISYGMGIPRQFQLLNIERMKKAGAERTGLYDMQAEDIGLCAKVIEKGGSLFRLPCFLYTVPTEKDYEIVTELHEPLTTIIPRAWEKHGITCSEKPQYKPKISH